MTATVTPIHRAHHARAPFGTGLHTAQLIVNGRRSLTPEPYLLERIDASQLQAPVRVVAGAVHEPRSCRPGVCEGLKACRDHDCEGHPSKHTPTDQDKDERGGLTFLGFWLGYLAVLAVAVAGAWQLASR